MEDWTLVGISKTQAGWVLTPNEYKLKVKEGQPENWPLAKPRREKVSFWWQPQVHVRGGRLGLIRNENLPFLKGQWLLPGEGREVKAAPKKFDYRHSITHYDIFVTVNLNAPKLKASECRWIAPEEIQQHVPTSLVVKALRSSRGAAGRSKHNGVRQHKARKLLGPARGGLKR